MLLPLLPLLLLLLPPLLRQHPRPTRLPSRLQQQQRAPRLLPRLQLRLRPVGRPLQLPRRHHSPYRLRRVRLLHPVQQLRVQAAPSRSAAFGASWAGRSAPTEEEPKAIFLPCVALPTNTRLAPALNAERWPGAGGAHLLLVYSAARGLLHGPPALDAHAPLALCLPRQPASKAPAHFVCNALVPCLCTMPSLRVPLCFAT